MGPPGPMGLPGPQGPSGLSIPGEPVSAHMHSITHAVTRTQTQSELQVNWYPVGRRLGTVGVETPQDAIIQSWPDGAQVTVLLQL